MEMICTLLALYEGNPLVTGWFFMEFNGAWLKLLSGKASNKLAHQMLAQSDQWDICRCKESAQPIRAQVMAGI